MFEYFGNMHIHSRYSDGSATIDQIRTAAKRAGLDFIIITDHFNLQAADQEGYKDDLLMLVGMEINEAHNHYLALDIKKVVKNNTDHPQEVINDVNEQGGIGIIAHPLEYASNFLNEGNVYNWIDWSVEGFQGIEIWNLLSQWKGSITNFFKALYYVLNPQGAIIGPYLQTMRRFDEYQQQGKRIVAFGGADAHAPGMRLGSLYFKIISYPFSFRSINMHILLQQPLSGDLSTDKAMVYNAFRSGSCWVANDYFKNSRGFSFVLCSEKQTFNMGELLSWQKNMKIKVHTPYLAQVKLFKDGLQVADSEGEEHLFERITKGIYRVEAYCQHKFKYRPWIFTNSIWVV